MHPDWVRSLRNQCQAAVVPFFFKQWGEWAPADLGCWVASNGGFSKNIYGTLNNSGTEQTHRGWMNMSRVGKKESGRLLDGREWNEFPS